MMEALEPITRRTQSKPPSLKQSTTVPISTGPQKKSQAGSRNLESSLAVSIVSSMMSQHTNPKQQSCTQAIIQPRNQSQGSSVLLAQTASLIPRYDTKQVNA